MTELVHRPNCWRPLASYRIEDGWCWAWCPQCGAVRLTRIHRNQPPKENR